MGFVVGEPGIDDAVRQPTMRRLNTSDTNAVNAMPDHVGTWVKSTTHSWFGFAAWKLRCTRSGGRAAETSGRVVLKPLYRRAPTVPWLA